MRPRPRLVRRPTTFSRPTPSRGATRRPSRRAFRCRTRARPHLTSAPPSPGGRGRASLRRSTTSASPTRRRSSSSCRRRAAATRRCGTRSNYPPKTAAIRRSTRSCRAWPTTTAPPSPGCSTTTSRSTACALRPWAPAEAAATPSRIARPPNARSTAAGDVNMDTLWQDMPECQADGAGGASGSGSAGGSSSGGHHSSGCSVVAPERASRTPLVALLGVMMLAGITKRRSRPPRM